jgi:photosystem II stability/assembly factor-like uncharacterized protein
MFSHINGPAMMRLVAVACRAEALACLLTLLLFAPPAPAQEEDDPDVPRFMLGKTSKEDFLRLREEQLNLIRGVPSGLAYDARLLALEQMDAQRAHTLAKVNATAWSPLGPSPIPNGQTQGAVTAVSGRVTAIAVHPTNPSIVYVGTAQGGVYRSVDGGTNWTPIFDGAQSLSIGAIAIAPSSPSTVFVGTGEPNYSGDSFGGVGLYRIDNADTAPVLVGPINPVRSYTDASGNPQNVAVFTGRSISKILVLPNNPSTLFVSTTSGIMGLGADATGGGTIPPLGIKGLYRLTNATGAAGSVVATKLTVATAGTNFDLPATGNRSIDDAVLDPADSTNNTLMVWVDGVNASGDGGVWRSTNALGATPAFTQTFTSTVSGGRSMFAIYRRPAQPAVVYMAGQEASTGTICNSATTYGALRVSTDGGLTWSPKFNAGGGFCGAQCWYDIALAVVPGATTSVDRIHIGGNVSSTNCTRMHARSTNGGTTFTNEDTGLHADTHVIVVAPSDPTVMYLGNDGGVYKSTDAGVTWTSLNNSGMSATQFQSIALHPTDRWFTIGGTQDNGTPWLKPDQTWTRADWGDGGFTAIDQNAVNTSNVTMYHTYYNQTNSLIGFARVTSTSSASDGLWNVFGCGATSNGISCGDAVMFYAPMVLGPNVAASNGTNTVYFGTDKLYRSVNSGATMTAVSQVFSSGNPVSAIAISPQDDNFRIAGGRSGYLYYTTTGAATLAVLDAVGGGGVIPDRFVGRIAFNPANKNTAFIALGGYMGGTSASQSHIWRVRNLSTTPVIAAINGSGGGVLPDVPVNAIVVDPLDSNTVYAGTDIGVYATTDGGASWAVFGSGLPRVAVFDMALHPVYRVLRVATHGRGIWENSGPPLPIQLASFNGTVTIGGGVQLTWTTLSELANYGFEVQKARSPDGPFTSITGSFTAGHGTTIDQHVYTYTDTDPGAPRIAYRLKQYDLDGTFHYSDAITVDIMTGVAETGSPTEFSLAQSYPNPFNPTTVIRYGLPRAASVRMEVFNMIGERVAVLVNEPQTAGYHEVRFNAAGLASGSYVYRIVAGDYAATKKLVLLK